MILLLETSTLNCSVALGTANGDLRVSQAQASDQYLHAEQLHVLIDGAVREAGITPNDLTAVAVGKGPGSFTGLRIGVSAAKGMCIGLDIPLLAPCPLQGLRHRAMLALPEFADQPERVIPAIDARRQDIYTLNAEGQPVAATVDVGFRTDLGSGPALLVGDGAEKCRTILGGHSADWSFLQVLPTAEDLLPEASALLAKGQIEDVAAFEPFYLKDFIPGRPKDPLGLRSTPA